MKERSLLCKSRRSGPDAMATRRTLPIAAPRANPAYHWKLLEGGMLQIAGPLSRAPGRQRKIRVALLQIPASLRSALRADRQLNVQEPFAAGPRIVQVLQFTMDEGFILDLTRAAREAQRLRTDLEWLKEGTAVGGPAPVSARAPLSQLAVDIGDVRFVQSVRAAKKLFEQAAQTETTDRKSLRRIAHRIAGTAPQLGFTYLGDCARTIDAQLRPGEREPNESTLTEWVHRMRQSACRCDRRTW